MNVAACPDRRNAFDKQPYIIVHTIGLKLIIWGFVVPKNEK